MSSGNPRQELARNFVDALGSADHDAAVSLMHANARLHVQAWQEPVVGTEALLVEFARQAGIFANFSTEYLQVSENADCVFSERLDSFEVGGKAVTIHWVGVFEFDGDNKIVSVRDYYDMSELQAQLAS